MKLVTFQSFAALKFLINNGYLETQDSNIDNLKSKPTYSFLASKMKEQIVPPPNVNYPLWCWVKCYNNICPPKKKGPKVPGFDVKITFHKEPKDVFITDYISYSFLLNNMYIPSSKKDKESFALKLKRAHITKEDLEAFVRPDKYPTHRTDAEYLKICELIQNSFTRCLNQDSDILQGCIWRLNLSDVESIEILPNDNYCYGSLNYVRSNGKRKNWQEEYYKKLK